MQMRPGGKTCHADRSHTVSLLDRMPGAYSRRDARQMGITGRESISMLDLDEIPVAAVRLARKCNNAIRNRYDRSARGRCIIDGEMWSCSSQDRVHPPRRVA